MKLLANENVPLASVRALRDLGHDVASIAEDSPGVSDEEVVDALLQCKDESDLRARLEALRR